MLFAAGGRAGKLSAQREESALHRGLTELLASYGVSIDPALLTPGETLYAIELGEADASAAAEARLGEAARADRQPSSTRDGDPLQRGTGGRRLVQSAAARSMRS